MGLHHRRLHGRVSLGLGGRDPPDGETYLTAPKGVEKAILPKIAIGQDGSVEVPDIARDLVVWPVQKVEDEHGQRVPRPAWTGRLVRR